MKTEKNSINVVPMSQWRSAIEMKCEENNLVMRENLMKTERTAKTATECQCIRFNFRYVLPFAYPLITVGGRKNPEKTVSDLRQRIETHLAQWLQTSCLYLLQRSWTDALKEDAEWFDVPATEAYGVTEIAIEPDKDGQDTGNSYVNVSQTIAGQLAVRIRLEGTITPSPQRLLDFLGEELLYLLQTEGSRSLKEELTSVVASDWDGADAVCRAWAESPWMPNFEVFFYGDTEEDERMFAMAHDEEFAVCRALIKTCLE